MASIQVAPGTAGAASIGQSVPFTATARDASGNPVTPEVESVEPNRLVWATDPRPSERAVDPAPRGTSYAPAEAVNEPYFTLQGWHYDVIGALRAWEVTTGSPSVIVAVVDDGIRFDHPDIAANLRSDGYARRRLVLDIRWGGPQRGSQDRILRPPVGGTRWQHDADVGIGSLRV